MTTLFFEAALRSLLMAGTVWAGIRLLRISNVFAQKTAWSLVLAASIAMPFLARSVPARPVVNLPAAYFVPAPVPPVTQAAQVSDDQSIAAPVVRFVPAAPPASRWHMPKLSTLVIPAYFGVSAILLLRIFIGLIIAARIWYRAQRASPILEPRATVRISSAIGSPVTIGSGIVLPDSYPEWNLAKLRMVLAHERSHVRQADFYLQLLAAVYTAIFWFSPVGWWLQRKLADLGEAISDRAALEEAANRDSYAEVLLEFARMPRRSLAGVHMARSSNLHRRIDRLLTDQQFRLAFIAVRRHVLIALAIVPLALLAATSLIGVKAAEAVAARAVKIHAPALQATAAPPAPLSPAAQLPVPPPAPATVPVPPTPPSADAQDVAEPPEAPGTPETPESPDVAPESPQGPEPPPPPDARAGAHFYYRDSEDGRRDSYALVNGDDSVTISGSDEFQESLEKAKQKHHAPFIWIERDGKSYVIDDPALVSQCRELFRPIEELGRKQAELGRQQAELGKKQAHWGEMQVKVAVPMPDLERELAQLDEQLKKLRELNGKPVQMQDLAEIQNRLGDLQGKLGQLEGLAGRMEAEYGGKEAELGKIEGDLGRQEGILGEQEGRLSMEADKKMKAIIKDSIKDGKAKPVD